MYRRIKYEDLIAREFKYHFNCYRDFTRGNATPTVPNNPTYDKGDFASVERFINNEILQNGRIIHLTELHQMFGLSVNDRRYTHHLKKLIKKKFGEKVIFLNRRNFKNQDYIASADMVNGGSHVRNETVQTAASYILEDIISHASRISELIWPPTIEQLTSENRQLPASLSLFFQTLLNPNKSDETESISRLRDSYSQDFIHAVTKGKTLTEKHFLMALGIHNLTGQRNVIELLNQGSN